MKCNLDFAIMWHAFLPDRCLMLPLGICGLHGSLVTSACVVCGVFNPVITTMEQHVYAGCPSICEKRRLSNACIVVVMAVQVETNYVGDSVVLLMISLKTNRLGFLYSL